MRLIFLVSFHFDILFSSPSPAAGAAPAQGVGNADTEATFLGAETAFVAAADSPSSIEPENLKSV